MVHKLPPVNKKRKRKETKIQSPTSTVVEEEALANLLNDLITADPQTTHPQHMPPKTVDKNHNLNVCPFHECNLILFEARTNWSVCIKCQMDQCSIFMHEDSAYHYMRNVCGRLHESYRKLSKTYEDLDMWLRRSGFAQSEQNRKNPGRPYFICRDRDCRFFQWADVELSKKNKNKQAKR